MNIPTLTTARLLLRPFTLQDVDALHGILSTEGILRYFPRTAPPPREQVERIVAHQLTHWEDHGCGWWAVELRDTPGLIGWCGLQYLPEFDAVEVAYLLGQPFWGKGLATEASRAAVRFGFAELGLERIVAIAHVDNQASQRVILKLGMTQVEALHLWGIDCYRYEVTPDQFVG